MYMNSMSATTTSSLATGSFPAPRRILAAAATGFADFVSAQGGDWDAVLSSVALDRNCLSDPRAVLDLGVYCAMMERAARDTHNENFGLRFGHQFQPEQLGPIGELALASPNVGTALGNLARFFPFHQQVTETRFETQGPWLSLEYRILDWRILARRQDAELTMGMFMNILRRAFGPSWSPHAVHFEHPRPSGGSEHRDYFQADVEFGQRTNAIVFRSQNLHQPMPAHDLRDMARLREELAGLAGGTGRLPMIERVKRELRSRLCDGEPGIEDIAAALGVARWTLQRRLSEQGKTFARLLNCVRKTMAMSYLQEPHLSMLDISTLLGYSETSAFTRAFRSWFQLSPTTARAMAQGNTSY